MMCYKISAKISANMIAKPITKSWIPIAYIYVCVFFLYIHQLSEFLNQAK